jgi:hypothetical protein
MGIKLEKWYDWMKVYVDEPELDKQLNDWFKSLNLDLKAYIYDLYTNKKLEDDIK